MPDRHVRLLVLAFLLALLTPLGPARAQTGSILGQLFTAEHPDSVASGAALTLIFRPPGGEVERISAVAGPSGEYEFSGISTDPEIQYVIRVSHFGQDFLGSPIQFEPGQTNLAYNFLVSRNAAPLPPDAMEGHPPMSGGRAPAAAPRGVRQDPLTMTVIVLTIFALFGLPIATAYRRDRLGDPVAAAATVPEADSLIRDIASLDLRHYRGDLEDTDYQAVRRSLLRKLEQITGVEDRSA